MLVFWEPVGWGRRRGRGSGNAGGRHGHGHGRDWGSVSVDGAGLCREIRTGTGIGGVGTVSGYNCVGAACLAP